MSKIKGRGQRLIPEELLKYLEAYKEAHPDPTQGGGATLDDIVDSAGNKRFIEGDLHIELTETDISTYGFQDLYSKWSLSGTHLMIVACMTVSSTWAPNKTIFSLTVPDFIYNKIFPLVEGGYVARIKAADTTGTDKLFQLYKESDNKLTIYTSANLTSGKVVRAQFDLLIDDDYSE